MFRKEGVAFQEIKFYDFLVVTEQETGKERKKQLLLSLFLSLNYEFDFFSYS